MKSVTKILSRLFPIDKSIPEYILEAARLRGVAVHEWIEQYNKFLMGEREDEPVIGLEYLVYADNYKKWISDYNIKPIFTELKLADEENQYNGVIDMICSINERIYVVDFKCTNTINKPYVELQTSAYKHLALVNEKIKVRNSKTAVLHITKTGYNFAETKYEWLMFKLLIALDNYLEKHERKAIGKSDKKLSQK